MAIDYVRGGNPRCPSLLVGGLLLICLFLTCSWWSLTSQNFELLNQITTLEEQLKLSGDELDKCMVGKDSLEEKAKSLQNSNAQSRVKVEQLQTEEDDLRETLSKTKEKLGQANKQISSLESSLNFKNTELESLKTLGEAKNKTLEALRTEKKTLITKLSEENAKIESLRGELASLQKQSDRVVQYVTKLPAQTNNEGNSQETAGIAVNENHESQTEDDNTAGENKGELPTLI